MHAEPTKWSLQHAVNLPSLVPELPYAAARYLMHSLIPGGVLYNLALALASLGLAYSYSKSV